VGLIREIDDTGQDPLITESVVLFQFDLQQSPPDRDTVRLIASGDPAPAPFDSYDFGGRLDTEQQGAGGAGNTFRGVVVNGDSLAFYAALVGQFQPLDPFEPADKIGLFRADLSTDPPIIECIALHGQPVNDSLVAPEAVFNDAVWEFPLYAPDSFNVWLPPRWQVLRGWAAPLSINENGLMEPLNKGATRPPNPWYHILTADDRR